jgi:hypothetical protein
MMMARYLKGGGRMDILKRWMRVRRSKHVLTKKSIDFIE